MSLTKVFIEKDFDNTRSNKRQQDWNMQGTYAD